MSMRKEKSVFRRFSALRSAAAAVLVAFGLSLVGCGGDAGTAVDDMERDVEDAAGRAADATRSAGEAVGDAARQAGEKMSEAYSAAAEKAEAALADVDGGQELLNKVKEMVASARETLANVENSDTAQAAMSKLDGLGDEADKVKDQIADLPEEARAALSNLYEMGVAQIKGLIDKVSEMPNVGDEVKSKLEELKAKLESA